MEEEDELARTDDPVALWLDDWAADAPWEKYASHTDPVGVSLSLAYSNPNGDSTLTVLETYAESKHHSRLVLKLVLHVRQHCL